MSRRDTAIHVRRSDLQKVFSKMKIDIDINQFIKETKPYAIRDRSIVKTTRTIKKKLDRIAEYDKVNVNQFQNKLITIRNQLGHRGVTQIRENDTTYSLLKEVTANAVEFCKAFGLGLERGFGIYIKLILDKANKKFRLNCLKSYKQYAFEAYEVTLIINGDKFANDTEDFYNEFLQIMHNEGVEDLDLTEAEYVDMILGREEADKLEANYTDFITAQFVGLSFSNDLPKGGAFHGAGSITRYKLYMKDTKKVNKIEKTAYDSI